MLSHTLPLLMSTPISTASIGAPFCAPDTLTGQMDRLALRWYVMNIVVGQVHHKLRFDATSGCAAAYLQVNQGAGRQSSSAAQLLPQNALEADQCTLTLLGVMT